MAKVKSVQHNSDISSWFHTSQLTTSLKAPPAPHIYSSINSESPAKSRHSIWSGQWAEPRAQLRVATVLSSAASFSHPSSMGPPAWAGGFSWPGEKCHSLKCNISLGWNLKYFSNIISTYSYSLCPSVWHREARDQSESPKSHMHISFPLNISIQLA